MRIALYCQNVFGVGHLRRSLSICQTLLKDHEVHFIQGGPDVGLTLNDESFHHHYLPPLLMSKDGVLYSPQGKSVEEVLSQRIEVLGRDTKKFDVLIIEFFPFGRYQFRDEIFTLIDGLKKRSEKLQIYASMRDIYTLKNDLSKRDKRAKYAKDILNKYFDALFIHSDPALIQLKDSYPCYDDIKIPIFYTGFTISELTYKDKKSERDIVVSLGGGQWGYELFKEVVAAAHQLSDFNFTFFEPALHDGHRLEELPSNVSISSFNNDNFKKLLEKAAYSISLAGYNTVFECLSAKTTPILYPWGENNEQPMRARLLAKKGLCYELDPQNKLSLQIIEIISEKGPLSLNTQLNFSGCVETSKIINHLQNS